MGNLGRAGYGASLEGMVSTILCRSKTSEVNPFLTVAILLRRL